MEKDHKPIRDFIKKTLDELAFKEDAVNQLTGPKSKQEKEFKRILLSTTEIIRKKQKEVAAEIKVPSQSVDDSFLEEVPSNAFSNASLSFGAQLKQLNKEYKALVDQLYLWYAEVEDKIRYFPDPPLEQEEGAFTKDVKNWYGFEDEQRKAEARVKARKAYAKEQIKKKKAPSIPKKNRNKT